MFKVYYFGIVFHLLLHCPIYGLLNTESFEMAKGKKSRLIYMHHRRLMADDPLILSIDDESTDGEVTIEHLPLTFCAQGSYHDEQYPNEAELPLGDRGRGYFASGFGDEETLVEEYAARSCNLQFAQMKDFDQEDISNGDEIEILTNSGQFAMRWQPQKLEMCGLHALNAVYLNVLSKNATDCYRFDPVTKDDMNAEARITAERVSQAQGFDIDYRQLYDPIAGFYQIEIVESCLELAFHKNNISIIPLVWSDDMWDQTNSDLAWRHPTPTIDVTSGKQVIQIYPLEPVQWYIFSTHTTNAQKWIDLLFATDYDTLETLHLATFSQTATQGIICLREGGHYIAYVKKQGQWYDLDSLKGYQEGDRLHSLEPTNFHMELKNRCTSLIVLMNFE